MTDGNDGVDNEMIFAVIVMMDTTDDGDDSGGDNFYGSNDSVDI